MYKRMICNICDCVPAAFEKGKEYSLREYTGKHRKELFRLSVCKK